MDTRNEVVAAAAASVIAAPGAAWFFIGPLQERPDQSATAADPTWAVAFGLSSTVVFFASLAFQAYMATKDWPRSGPVVLTTVPLIFAGLAAGATVRLVTAETDGANIGGALALVALPAVIFVAALASWAISRRIERTDSDSGRP